MIRIPTLFLLSLATVAAQTALLPADTLSGFRLSASNAPGCRVERVAVEGQTFAEALRLTTAEIPVTRTDREWACRIIANITAPVMRNDWILATFWVRRQGASAQTRLVFERNGNPYNKSVSALVAAPAEWKRFQIPFQADDNYLANAASVHFWGGYDPQVVEVGGVAVENLGPLSAAPNVDSGLTYVGRELDALWRVAANERIDRIRKAGLVVTVVDAAGKPVEGATIRLRMKKHAFGFGTAVVAERLLSETPENQKYRARFLELFTKAVFENDLKWQGWESNRQRALNGIRWLRENGITDIRGHTLVWPAWRYLPSNLQTLAGDPAALRARIDAHITDEVSGTRGMLTDWDVINEAIPNRDLQNILGDEEMIRWFQLARESDPDARLFINDFSIVESPNPNHPKTGQFYDQVKWLIDSGAPIGGIGIQGHFDTGVNPPEGVLTILDKYAQLGLDIQITEFDVNTFDERLQADYTRDFLTACFSHPSITGFLMWGFWEGAHWIPRAAMYRRDWSEKPNGTAWRQLLFETWWTSVDGVSGADGTFTVRGFLGDYEVEAAVGETSVKQPLRLVPADSTVTLRLP